MYFAVVLMYYSYHLSTRTSEVEDESTSNQEAFLSYAVLLFAGYNMIPEVFALYK